MTIEEKNQFLDKVEDFVSAKGMDEAIEEKFQSYLDRANLAITTRMYKDNEDVLPIVSQTPKTLFASSNPLLRFFLICSLI